LIIGLVAYIAHNENPWVAGEVIEPSRGRRLAVSGTAQEGKTGSNNANNLGP